MWFFDSELIEKSSIKNKTKMFFLSISYFTHILAIKQLADNVLKSQKIIAFELRKQVYFVHSIVSKTHFLQFNWYLMLHLYKSTKIKKPLSIFQFRMTIITTLLFLLLNDTLAFQNPIYRRIHPVYLICQFSTNFQFKSIILPIRKLC